MLSKVNKSQLYFLGIFTLIIVGISSFLHYSPHIIDMLTLQKVEAYDIHISIWRILFEPVIGLLLYFNRSLYGLTELPILLIWILGGFIVFTIYKYIITKDTRARKNFIISQVLNFPLVIILWFVAFVLMLFIPLPNNTIVNNSKNSVLVTTHSHTQFSHDGLTSQKRLWKWHKRNGFDAFFITDHARHGQTLDFIQAQRNKEFPIEPLIMCGEEYSASNHLSLLGLKTNFDTKGFADTTVIKTVRADGGAVIVNHWFDDEHESLAYYKALGVDGFEIENAGKDLFYDRDLHQRIKEFCEQNNLIMVAGLDFHGYGNACSMWNAFEIPNWKNLNPTEKEAAIINILKTRDQSKLQILFYSDRPYYDKTNIWISPLRTIFNYFRTLNFLQIISWIFWIVVLMLLKTKVSITPSRFLNILAILGTIFLLVLGMVYYAKLEEVIGYSDVYEEYSSMLFKVGGGFFIYSVLILFFSKKNSRSKV